jgi:hypothetical protein
MACGGLKHLVDVELRRTSFISLLLTAFTIRCFVPQHANEIRALHTEEKDAKKRRKESDKIKRLAKRKIINILFSVSAFYVIESTNDRYKTSSSTLK